MSITTATMLVTLALGPRGTEAGGLSASDPAATTRRGTTPVGVTARPSRRLRERDGWPRATAAVEVEPAALVASLEATEGITLDPSAPRLVEVPRAGHFELAWEVELPLSFVGGTPTRQTRWYEVGEGRELMRREHVRAATADVFPTNPVASPSPERVELDDLVADVLDGERTSVWGCGLEATEDDPGWSNQGECIPVRRARVDDEGHVGAPLPTIDFEDGLIIDDPYTEVSLYHHAERFGRALAEWGDYSLPCEHVELWGNYVGVGSEGPVAVDNAFYTGSCDGRPIAVFGQGAQADYAYDGDVIYHELGHGVIDAQTPWGLWRPSCDEHTCSNDAAAINEAIADYLSMAITGDPHTAEYVAQRRGLEGPGFRSADNDKRCPDDLVGEPHQDSEVVSGALWSARMRLGPSLDRVVLDTLSGLPEDLRFEELSAHVLEVAARSDEGMAEVLREALASRGLLSCERSIPLETERALLLPGPPVPMQRAWPGPLQLELEIPPTAGRIELRVAASVRTSSSGDAIALGASSIRGWVSSESEVVFAGPPDDPTSVIGPGVQELIIAPLEDSSELLITIEEPVPGSAWIAVANALSSSPLELTIVDVQIVDAPASGCGISARPRSPAPSLAMGLLLVLVGRTRRGRGDTKRGKR